MNKFRDTIISSMSLQDKMIRLNILIFLGMSLTLCSFPVLGQGDKKENAPEKAMPQISMIGTQINGDSILLQTTVKVKRDNLWQAVDFESVRFYIRNDSVTSTAGKALTDDMGVASVKVGVNQLITGEDGLWMFGSVFEGNETLDEGEAELSIRAAGIELSGEKQDTTYAVTLRLSIPGPENLPIKDAEVGFYVKRHFSNLKIGEGTTDENGEVTIDCPTDLPGDTQGKIILIGQADDLEEYGSVAAYMEKPWGVPLQEPDQEIIRALWSHLPPRWMVIVFAILMSVVWGHYIVIIYKLFTFRKPKIQNP